MSRFNTGNKIDSDDLKDLSDNAKNMDLAANSDMDTFQDRLGRSRLTWAGIEKAGSGDPALAVDAAARAEAAASTAETAADNVEQNAEQIAQDAAQQAVQDVVDGVDGAVDRAEGAAARAETASDAAFVNADVYPDIASGRAAVADGEQFQVVDGDEVVRYRRDSASTQTQVARYPASSSLTSMLRQADSIESGLAVSKPNEKFIVPSNNGATIYSAIKNLYDPAAAVRDRFVNPDGFSVDAVGWAHSDYIEVTPGDTLSISSNAPKRRGCIFYTSSKVAIGSIDNSIENPLSLIAPAGAAYFRMNVESPTEPEPSEIMVNHGPPVDYVEYGAGMFGSEVVSLVPQNKFALVTDEIASKNLIIPDRIVSDAYLASAEPSPIVAGDNGVGWSYCSIPVSEGDVLTVYSASGKPRRGGAAFFAEALPVPGDTAIPGTYAADETITLTAPAGAQSFVCNIQSTAVPAPDDLMIIAGSKLVPYEPPFPRVVVPQSAIYPALGADGEKKLSLFLAETRGATSSVSSASGLIRKFVAYPDELVTSYPVRFNLGEDSVPGVTLRDSRDEIAADHIFGVTLGANHGYMLGECTAAGHGKVDAECGSVWSSGGKEYVLADVVDANKLLIAQRTSNNVPPTGTYNHVSGAGNTGSIEVTAVTPRQWYPPHKNWAMTTLADGNPITPDGSTINADRVQFVEQADILARADIIDAWIANGGIPGGYEPDGEASMAENITYSYDSRGQLTIYREWLMLKDLPVRDLMGLQFARQGNELYIVPGSLPFTYGGTTVDYSMGVAADNTLSSGVSVNFLADNLQSTGEYAHRVLVVYPDAVFAIGLVPTADAEYSVRRERVSNRALEIRGNTGKLYFRVLDIGDHMAVAGDRYSVVGYRYILPKSTDRTAFYAVEGGGATWVFADWHNKDGLDRLPIDEQYPELIGKSFEVIEARNVTTKGGIVAGPLSVIVSAATSSATLILKVT